MEVPGAARKSVVVLLVRANLGSAGNLTETPREIFTLFSCIKGSTQLQNLRNDIWLPTGSSGLSLAFSPAQFRLRQQSQVTGLTGAWGRDLCPAGSCMRPFTLHRHCARKCVLIFPSHPRKLSQSRGVHLSNFTQLINSQVHKLKHIHNSKNSTFSLPLCVSEVPEGIPLLQET